MCKVKIFQFMACDCRYSQRTGFDKLTMDRTFAENVLNEFIKDKKGVSITQSVVTERQHNNGGYNTVSIVYTVTYESGDESAPSIGEEMA